MKYKLKIVPDNEPNADGRWITVETPKAAPEHGWNRIAAFFKSHIPKGEHLVSYERA